MQIDEIIEGFKKSQFVWGGDFWLRSLMEINIPSEYRSSEYLGLGKSSLSVDMEMMEGKKIIIEFPCGDLKVRYGFNNLQFLSEEDWGDWYKSRILESLAILKKCEDLYLLICKVVGIFHPLVARQGYDVSYSEPSLPFSIFVSIPSPSEKDGTLRVAEGILHESMHLLLSIVNEKIPLICGPEGQTYFSPWKNEARPVYGVLHGLFVFSVIYQWLLVCENNEKYSVNRRSQIKEDFSYLMDFAKGDFLTPVGRALVEKCFECVEGDIIL